MLYDLRQGGTVNRWAKCPTVAARPRSHRAGALPRLRPEGGTVGPANGAGGAVGRPRHTTRGSHEEPARYQPAITSAFVFNDDGSVTFDFDVWCPLYRCFDDDVRSERSPEIVALRSAGVA